MNRRDSMGALAAMGLGAMGASAMAAQDGGGASPDTLFMLWTSGDPDVAHRMALMYSHAAKRFGWYDDVTLIVWGPSQRLLCADKDLKAKINEMQDDGVKVEACIACAQTYGLVDDLKQLGLPVIGQGGPLSNAMKDPMVSVLTV
ncbi:MAG: DsrE family protein [Planctomycetota bacterium]